MGVFIWLGLAFLTAHLLIVWFRESGSDRAVRRSPSPSLPHRPEPPRSRPTVVLSQLPFSPRSTTYPFTTSLRKPLGFRAEGQFLTFYFAKHLTQHLRE